MNYFVKIKNYYAAKYTVTYGFWNNVCEQSKKMGYDIFKRGKDPTLPVGLVNYYDAAKFCNALSEILGLEPVYYCGSEVFKSGKNGNLEIIGRGIRLPFKSEWEYSVQKDSKSRYFWGDELKNNTDNPYAWMYDFYDKETPCLIRRPGLKKPNEFGLYDTLGNVCEWCNDTYKDTDYKIIKGGSVGLDSVLDTRYDALLPPYARYFDVGIRLFSDFYVEIPEYLLEEKPCNYYFVNDTFDIFSLLDFEDERIKDVVSLYKAGKIKEAKREYLNVLKKEGEKYVYKKPENYLEFMKKLDVYMNASGTLYPYKNSEEGIVEAYYYIEVIFEKYRENKEDKYINQIVYLLNQGLGRNKNAFDNLTNEQLNSPAEWATNSWNYLQGFDSMGRAIGGLKGLVDKILPNITEEQLTDEVVDTFIRLIVTIVTEDIPCWIKDGRAGVPNQYIHTAISAITASLKLVGIKEAKWYYELGKERLLDAVLNQTVLKDGSDMEQSYNYNYSLINAYRLLGEIFNNKIPGEFAPVKDLVIKRIRFLKGIETPSGPYPSSGTSSGIFPPCLPDKEKAVFVERIKKSHRFNFSDIDYKKPKFLTINFPYSNTTVMRDS